MDLGLAEMSKAKGPIFCFLFFFSVPYGKGSWNGMGGGEEEEEGEVGRNSEAMTVYVRSGDGPIVNGRVWIVGVKRRRPR
jgi:hypothetical protein